MHCTISCNMLVISNCQTVAIHYIALFVTCKLQNLITSICSCHVTWLITCLDITFNTCDIFFDPLYNPVGLIIKSISIRVSSDQQVLSCAWCDLWVTPGQFVMFLLWYICITYYFHITYEYLNIFIHLLYCLNIYAFTFINN